MNLSIFTLLTCLHVLLLAPAKDTINPHKTIVSKTHIASTGVWATQWEAVPDWASSQKDGLQVYSYNRSTPELNQAILENGAVVVFAKGYDFEGFSKNAVKPLNLPFYLMTTDINTSGTFAWYSQNSIGSIQVGLKMNGPLESLFLQSAKDIRFRYFVLSKDFLQQHQLTPQALRSLSYKNFTELLGVAP